MVTNAVENDEGVPSDAEMSITELKASNASLLRSNNELLQYAHVASHDLQEPLRKIEMFASVLRSRKELADPEQEVVEKIQRASNRMRLLITDLLEYAKVAKSDKMFRPVDLNGLVAQLLDDFELLISEKQASVTVGNLPEVNAAALEMNQLFYNLINNALKFSDPSRKPEISITAKKLDDAAIKTQIHEPKTGSTYYDIAVSDNGIGFDTKYAEQIFLIFKKLHAKEIYPGSGIGLSICRSIAANHEGAIFVESKPGEGSTFHIIIPQ